MKIELFPYERRSLETLERQFGFERKTIVGFAQSLNSLRKAFAKVAGRPEQEFRAGRLVIMGLINHTHQLLGGGLQALEAGNGVVWSACVRGLIETFGACVMISERPERITRHLENVSAGTLYNAAKRSKAELEGDIKRLHQIVHPGPGAIYSGFKLVDDKDRSVEFKLGLRKPEPAEGREAVTVLANLVVCLEEKFEALARNDKVLAAGKVVMVRNGG